MCDAEKSSAVQCSINNNSVETNLLDWRRVVKREKKGKQNQKGNATRTAVFEGYTFLTVVIYCVYICIHSVYDLARNGECSVDFLPASNSELLVENRIGS